LLQAIKNFATLSKTGEADRLVILTPQSRSFIMQYVCLVYFDPQKVFNQSEEGEAVLRDSASFLDELKASGQLVMNQALQFPDQAMTVKVRDGKMSATDGPFMETREMLGGLIILEARDLNEAVRIAGGIPLARLGSVEVRPVVDFSKARPQL
jgi:hypothetical protein